MTRATFMWTPCLGEKVGGRDEKSKGSFGGVRENFPGQSLAATRTSQQEAPDNVFLHRHSDNPLTASDVSRPNSLDHHAVSSPRWNIFQTSTGELPVPAETFRQIHPFLLLHRTSPFIRVRVFRYLLPCRRLTDGQI